MTPTCRSMPAHTTKLVVLAALLGAASCAAPPPAHYPDPGVQVPERWAASPGQVDEPLAAPGIAWWTDLGDESLDALVLEALAHNHDLEAAAARVHSAAARVHIAGADSLPQLGLRLDGTRRQQSFIGLPIPGGPDVLTSRSTSHGVSLDISWEVDIWGRLLAGKEAALADRQGAIADLHGASLSIVGQTAKAWFTLVESSRQVALAMAAVVSYRATLTRVDDRYQRGLRPALDVRLAESNLAGAEANLEVRRGTRDRVSRQLEILLGRYPSGELEAGPDLPAPTVAIPAGLPASLVTRRPDLAVLERRLAASGARVNQARRALYPRFSLTTAGGTSSTELGDLVDGDFSVWRLAGNILQPLFQGGRLLAGVDLAEASQREATAAFVAGALRAYAEVESSLAAERFLAAQERALTRQVEQSNAAEDLATGRYGRGLDDIITLLSAQVQRVQAESRLLTVRRLRIENRIDLYLAVGGGFERALALAEERAPDTVDSP